MSLSFGVCIALEMALFVFANDSSVNSQNIAILQKLKTLEVEVSMLKQRELKTLEEVSMLKQSLKSCQSGCNESSKSNTETRERRIVPQGQESQVAFHAHLSNNVQNLGLHQAIHFDKVLLNEGNGYSVHAGEFVAPVSGLYVFAWTISSGEHTCLKYDVVKNSAILAYYVSDAHDHDDWAVSSGTAVTRMNLGDRVWIRVSDYLPCSHIVYGAGLGTSSFAGYLLH
ncbi:heavy metal-binding protein HIP-like [Crassostrea angulata]|uniref:heavy metal-binding protein HIP-like n=1 Tax=Magallana angulata TaxID=2784310 RepID=UPI0022B1288A|nr:heavy metal-binding protein HIP-like [Crassostrea angulata]